MHPQRETAVRGRLVHAGFVAVAAVAVVTHAFSGQPVRSAVFITIIALPMAAVFVGMRLNPVVDRFVWGVAVIGLVLQAIMQVIWPTYFAEQLGKGEGTLADLAIAGAHLFLLAASLLLVTRHAVNDPGGVIDSAIVGLCASAPLWEWVLLPHLRASGAPPTGQVVLLLDVLVLSGVLGSLLRVATTNRRARAAVVYLLAALVATLVAITVAVLTTGSSVRGWQAELLIVAFLSFGAAPLHPAAAHLMVSDGRGRRKLDRSNLAFLGVALAVFPVIAIVQAMWGQPSDPLLFGIGSLITVPLVVVRLGQLAAQRERAERILAHHARHDELTGLLNRRAMLDEIDGALAALDRGDLDSVGLLFCDLDGFKPVNDRLGHQAGDVLLQVVAARLATCTRASDTVARFGGDEFVILCRGGGETAVEQLVARVQDAIAAPVSLVGTGIAIGVSVGAALTTAAGELTRDGLVSAADARMYERKHRRPGRQRTDAAGIPVMRGSEVAP